jgi:hypothetical protein
MATSKLTDFVRALLASAREEFAERRGQGSGLTRNMSDFVLVVLVAPIRGEIAEWQRAYGWARFMVSLAMACPRSESGK